MPKSQAEIRTQIEHVLLDLPSMIPRDQLAKLLGLCPRTLGNYDCKALGVRNPIRIGRRVIYEKDAVLDWLVARAEQQESKR